MGIASTADIVKSLFNINIGYVTGPPPPDELSDAVELLSPPQPIHAMRIKAEIKDMKFFVKTIALLQLYVPSTVKQLT